MNAWARHVAALPPPPQIRDHVKAALKPRYKARQLDDAGCKWVLKKVVDKVMQTTRGVGAELLAAGGGDGFMHRWGGLGG